MTAKIFKNHELHEFDELFLACGFLNYYRISQIMRSASQASNAILCNGHHSKLRAAVSLDNWCNSNIIVDTAQPKIRQIRVIRGS